MKRLISISISFLFCSLLYGQENNLSWHLSGQTHDGSVKAFFVSGKNNSCRNVLVFKKEKTWDTLNLCKYASMLPDFKDTCRIQSIQMDGQGLNEIVVSWDSQHIDKNGIQRFTIYTIWDLDTKQNIFYITPSYYRFTRECIYSINESHKIIDSTITLDSCIYKCNFEINTNGQILVNRLKQIGRCPDNNCWKRTEGIYFYEDKKLQRKTENNGG